MEARPAVGQLLITGVAATLIPLGVQTTAHGMWSHRVHLIVARRAFLVDASGLSVTLRARSAADAQNLALGSMKSVNTKSLQRFVVETMWFNITELWTLLAL